MAATCLPTAILLSTAAVLFDRPQFAAAARTLHEDTLWLLGSDSAEAFEALAAHDPEVPSLEPFPEGGFAVLRAPGVHVLLDAGPVGLRGRGGHGHNDACSVEIWMGGAPLVVDPGCFAYTSDVEARYSFRSTRAHNGPMLSDHEINEVMGLWQLRDDAQANITVAEPIGGGARAVGRHTGYLRFAPGATVEREVVVSANTCAISDRVGDTG